MSEPARPYAPPPWLGAALLTLLACQVGLLWMHGTMLERQHGELLGLRQDIQELAESLDEMDQGGEQGSSLPRPSRHRIHRHPPVARVRWQEIQASAGFVLEALEQLEAMAESPLAGPLGELRPDHLAVALVEGWRGEIAHLAVTGGDGRFSLYKIVDPSFHNWIGLAMALRGEDISDFPLCNKSFNLSYCGFDL